MNTDKAETKQGGGASFFARNNTVAVNIPYLVGRRCCAAGRAATRPYLGSATVFLDPL